MTQGVLWKWAEVADDAIEVSNWTLNRGWVFFKIKIWGVILCKAILGFVQIGRADSDCACFHDHTFAEIFVRNRKRSKVSLHFFYLQDT